MFDTVSLDQLATFEMGQSPDSKFVVESDEGTPFLQGCTEFGAITPNSVVSCIRPKKICKPGDILISVRAPVGDLNKADREYCIGRGLAAIRFDDGIDARLGWHLLSYWVLGLRVVAQGSTFKAIGRTELANLQVADVPIPEQRRIAEILDTIDDAIQKTEALISKLKAMKQGLLHDLLTRGLDKSGKLRDPKAHPEQFKDSPLGNAPRSWRVQKLQSFYDEPSVNGLYKPKKYYGHGPLMIHMPQMFRGLIIDTSDAARVEVNSAEIDRYGLRNGDLVFARRSLNLEGAGRCALVNDLTETTTFESSIIRVRIRQEELLPEFVNYFLNSAIGFRLRLPLIRQVAVSGVSSGDIASIPIPCPSISEQERIIQVIEAHVSHIRNEKQYRDKLKLQKKGIMHDLLTGKVRVKV